MTRHTTSAGAKAREIDALLEKLATQPGAAALAPDRQTAGDSMRAALDAARRRVAQQRRDDDLRREDRRRDDPRRDDPHRRPTQHR